jgi:3-methyl-2-oxobutanoate hydroxymethyltransferase
VRTRSFPDDEHSFKSGPMRLVSSNPEARPTERDEKPALAAVESVGPIYGVPV